MAVDFGDHWSGFRHNEVIGFISNEILMNGGGPEFYQAFCSCPWNEVEDQLRSIVVEPQVPLSMKRAYTWSALALSVRVATWQWEQQTCQTWQPQEQVEECEVASSALTSELQWLREEQEEASLELQFTQVALQHALNKCDVLLEQLLQVKRMVQDVLLPLEIVPVLQVMPQGGGRMAPGCR
ncbi:testis-expressed protein 13D [Orycteropus afer afer]|uniref:Testis-expressed protein 13D n=1 Tax=Orycteropus afer afer TaxID=1230840 RepID=A0AC54ZEB0_ORYAF|nr:testis-expressed protein 13D [Orycteropus afer afer]